MHITPLQCDERKTSRVVVVGKVSSWFALARWNLKMKIDVENEWEFILNCVICYVAVIDLLHIFQSIRLTISISLRSLAHKVQFQVTQQSFNPSSFCYCSFQQCNFSKWLHDKLTEANCVSLRSIKFRKSTPPPPPPRGNVTGEKKPVNGMRRNRDN